MTSLARSRPIRPDQALARRFRSSMSKTPSGACAMTALGMPFSRISAVSARVSMPDRATMPRRFSHWSRSAAGAVVGRVGDVGLEHRADGAGAGGRVEVLDVLVIGADIADMREGEGDDLAGIGRVGEDFLVAGQRRVEADFGDRASGGAKAAPFDDRAVGQHQQGGRLFGGPGGQRSSAMAALLSGCALRTGPCAQSRSNRRAAAISRTCQRINSLSHARPST